ncbi:MAG: polymerase alpha subunit [Blastococcus sp.]|nr:polymerase alpha subunit [Blastococcus sp.]
MSDPFVHLHVASGYSMRYGANHPADLVTRAAEHGMTALALTDRDGLYGAVKFALACRSAGVRPIFGVDLAVAPALDATVPPALAHALGGEASGARPPRVDAGPTAGRDPAAARACRPQLGRTVYDGRVPDRRGERRRHRHVEGGSDGEVDAEDRPHAGRATGEGELHRPVQTVTVGQCQRRHAVLGGPGDEIGGMVGPEPHGVAGGDVQVDEGVGHRRDPAGDPEREPVPPTTRGRGKAGSGGSGMCAPRQPSTTARKAPTSRTRSSASRSVTARESPASAAARLAAPAAKKVAHSPSSGAT